MKPHPEPRFEVVPRRRLTGRGLRVAVLLGWLLSLAAVWALATWRATPALSSVTSQLREAERQRAESERQVRDLSQRLKTLEKSDQISRTANSELQATLAERDEEIASLRADVAFYERLVGATGQRKGLNVHSVEFAPEAGGTWQYKVVLTQNLNRGAISQGQMRLAVEGVRGGKLATVDWGELHQKPQAPGQEYSFRYFQELTGSVMLPKDFTPQRVRVSLRGSGTSVDQTFDWRLAGAGGGK